MEPVKVPHSYSMFIGFKDGKLIQWSIRQRKVIKNYGQVIEENITAMSTTPDKKNLILGDRAMN
jgi:hypothetical protein